MIPSTIERIYVEKGVRHEPMTEAVLSRAANIPVEYVDDVPSLLRQVSAHPDPIGYGKKHMLITTYKGQMLKPCPGTPQVLCCNYHVLNPVLGCPFDCTYCALQIYFNNPCITVYTNLADLFIELDEKLRRTRPWLFRIGTGELTDSLALDHPTGINTLLVPHFADKENVLFELKTKSNRIENLLHLNHEDELSWPGRSTRHR